MKPSVAVVYDGESISKSIPFRPRWRMYSLVISRPCVEVFLRRVPVLEGLLRVTGASFRILSRYPATADLIRMMVLRVGNPPGLRLFDFGFGQLGFLGRHHGHSVSSTIAQVSGVIRPGALRPFGPYSR